MHTIVSLLLALVATWVPGEQSATSSGLMLLVGAAESGQQVTFSLAVDNPGPPVEVTFPSSQLYDIVVSNGETEIWRWSADRFFTMAVQQRTFPTGVTLIERATWDGRDSAGTAVAPGTYRAIATLATAPPVTGNPMEIVIPAPSS